MDFILTEEQIEEITAELHEKVQFYDKAGNPANGAVLAQITEVLTLRFGVDDDDEKTS